MSLSIFYELMIYELTITSDHINYYNNLTYHTLADMIQLFDITLCLESTNMKQLLDILLKKYASEIC